MGIYGLGWLFRLFPAPSAIDAMRRYAPVGDRREDTKDIGLVACQALAGPAVDNGEAASLGGTIETDDVEPLFEIVHRAIQELS